MTEELKEIINEIRPMLQADGGDIELISVDEERGIIKIKLKGACGGCPYAGMTLKEWIEKYIKEKLPQVRKMEAIYGLR